MHKACALVKLICLMQIKMELKLHLFKLKGCLNGPHKYL